MATSPKTKPAAKASKKGFEETLWDSANKLRGSVESSEYKHIVLSLIFLKFISDKFEVQKAKIAEQYGADFVDMVDFYTQDNVFYLPEESRWSYGNCSAPPHKSGIF
ncbi:type I restriction-modification system subunit M N-terminal domain-containing protein [Endozoicomonas sp. SCSIO W0465]|uniref:type I restriction-modification system subunit M N-terminal domain-containing protein n=1 Tax=Endozoicomonas sp. SCSIO W0465 TaxID=2918516 RepID=UPI0020753D8F|nr:type I restriction-modification system subunit M N-terminal domain-containing protein [Endozoicomonas sp. SCSIO W0465]USE36458.1 type I restriction-modification system subunit M N-terminal domain-containing protein [Endozoicomonas sp. SCSIO W0465]